MKLTVLGSGTYQPQLERHSSAYLLEIDGQKICLDFGRGAIDQLLKLGLRITEIDTVFISHWHADHVTDLLPLLHYTCAPLPDNLSEFKPIRTKPLKIYGPKGTIENIKSFLNVIKYGENTLKNLEVIELAEDKVEDSYSVQSFLTNHAPNSLCYRFEYQGKSLAYSGDGGDSSGLRKALNNVDLAIIDTSWPKTIEPKTHLNGVFVGKIAQEERVKRLILTHLSPYYLNNFNPISEVKENFEGEIAIAQDLMQVDV